MFGISMAQKPVARTRVKGKTLDQSFHCRLRQFHFHFISLRSTHLSPQPILLWFDYHEVRVEWERANSIKKKSYNISISLDLLLHPLGQFPRCYGLLHFYYFKLCRYAAVLCGEIEPSVVHVHRIVRNKRIMSYRTMFCLDRPKFLSKLWSMDEGFCMFCPFSPDSSNVEWT